MSTIVVKSERPKPALAFGESGNSMGDLGTTAKAQP